MQTDESLKEEIKDVLLCFLKDTKNAMEVVASASYEISDGRTVRRDEESLNDAVTVLFEMMKK